MFGRKLAISAALALTLGGVAAAQTPAIKVKEEKAGMIKEARVKPEAAIKSAQAAVPNGRISSAEMEREGGKLIYSFDIKVPGKSGIEEINIDAMTGKVLAHEHEGPAKERAEKRAEKKETTSPKTKH